MTQATALINTSPCCSAGFGNLNYAKWNYGCHREL